MAATILSWLPGQAPGQHPVGEYSITTTDGVKLVYHKEGKEGPPVVLVHGWSGSSAYFEAARKELARTCVVYSYDQRFHGASDKPAWGYHVARLAADLHELLRQLGLQEVTVVGASMGAAVIWSYYELFGKERLARAVFVDQAPLQWVTAEWKCGSNGCYDVASLTRLQCKVETDFAGFAKENAATCASLPLPPATAKALEAETLKADPKALALLMADHAQLDWRPLLPRVSIPCLNLVGRKSAVFPWYGCEVVGKLIPTCHTVFAEDANHWLYIEKPEAFAKLVKDFAHQGFVGISTVLTM